MAEPSGTEESSTRERVIDAAVSSILELGFYRASSNEIARRAGVTWGVIQYHFGTREKLLVACLRAGTARLESLLTEADVVGATFEERLGRYFALLRKWY